MRKGLVLISLFLYFHGNSQTTFNEVFNNPYYINGSGRGQAVIQVEDKIYTFGRIADSDSYTIGIALVYGETGQLLDTIRFDSAVDTFHVNLVDDYGIDFDVLNQEFIAMNSEFHGPIGALGYNRNTLLRVGLNGETIVAYEHEEIDDFDYAFRPIRTYKSGYIAVGVAVHDTVTFVSNNGDYGFLMRLDSVGNQIWVQRYEQAVDIDYMDINEDGEFILGSFDMQLGPGLSNEHLIIKCDTAGNEQWRLIFGDENFNGSPPVEFTNEGDIITISRYYYDEDASFSIRLMKIQDMETFGEVIQDVEYFNHPFNAQNPYCFKEDNEGNIYGGGGYQYWDPAEDSLSRPAYLIKLNSDLDSLWFRSYLHYNAESALHRIRNIDFSDDGCILLVGEADEALDSSGNPGLSHIWTLKVDSFGCLEPGCHLISGLEEIMVGMQNSMKAYPNPVQDQLTIEWNLEATSRLRSMTAQRLIIFNSLGQVVFEKPLENGTTIQEFQILNFTSGMYTAHWMSGNTWLDSVKFIKN